MLGCLISDLVSNVYVLQISYVTGQLNRWVASQKCFWGVGQLSLSEAGQKSVWGPRKLHHAEQRDVRSTGAELDVQESQAVC